MWLTHTHVHGNNHVYTGLIGIGLKFSWVKQRTEEEQRSFLGLNRELGCPWPDRLFKDYIMSL